MINVTEIYELIMICLFTKLFFFYLDMKRIHGIDYHKYNGLIHHLWEKELLFP